MPHYIGPVVFTSLVQDILGVNTSAAVTETAHSVYGVFVVTTKTESAEFLIRTQTMSYDGILETDSFLSDN
jgi:Na+/H+-dicarboxylate symporter